MGEGAPVSPSPRASACQPFPRRPRSKVFGLELNLASHYPPRSPLPSLGPHEPHPFRLQIPSRGLAQGRISAEPLSQSYGVLQGQTDSALQGADLRLADPPTEAESSRETSQCSGHSCTSTLAAREVGQPPGPPSSLHRVSGSGPRLPGTVTPPLHRPPITTEAGWGLAFSLVRITPRGSLSQRRHFNGRVIRFGPAMPSLPPPAGGRREQGHPHLTSPLALVCGSPSLLGPGKSPSP